MPSYYRDKLLKKAAATPLWDMIVIGGGATGLGIAVDAASRGYSTLLLEASDFAKGTSSRSTKLIHGGVRYLAQGNISLVYEALHERGILLRNASHLVHRQGFLIPCYSWWERAKYLCGLKLYDWLSGRLSLGSSQYITNDQVRTHIPAIRQQGLAGGVLYFDGQFNDARLAVNLAQTIIDNGGVALNYCKVTELVKDSGGKLIGVMAQDEETGIVYHFEAKMIINATGIFTDTIRKMDEPQQPPMVQVSQGIHLVVNRSFLKSSQALMIPKTPDGRVLFAVPWEEHVLIGTTDTPIEGPVSEPIAQETEVQFILDTVSQYLSPAPQRKDVLSVFAGLRPLVAVPKQVTRTKDLSRDHTIVVSESNLLTISGGKWTTYRRMAEDAVDKAITTGNLPHRSCITQQLKIHGANGHAAEGHWSVYGSDAAGIRKLIEKESTLGEALLEGWPYTVAEVVWAVRNELARTVEDILARRLRILFLNAEAAVEAAPQVARILRTELMKDETWEKEQVSAFLRIAEHYILKTPAKTKMTI